MAEGMFEGLLGGEDEEPRSEALEAGVIGAEAFAAAVAAHQAGYGPAVARATERFLEDQSHLLRTQTRLIEDEHNLRVAHLRGQSREGKLRRLGMRIRIGVQIFTALVLTAIGAGLVTMVYDAVTSNTVVVDSFDTPPALAARGLSGKVFASAVLDALVKMQSAARSPEKGLSAVSAWSSDIRVEVPETGVSIGEISRLLHERLGNDLHISGEVVQAKAGGLTLMVRGDGVPAKSFAGDDQDLDKLAVQAAEYIYGRAQPVEYGRYLSNNERNEEAISFLSAAMTRTDNNLQRGEMANYWANSLANLGRGVEAETKYRLAMSFNPAGKWKYWGNLIGTLSFFGQDGEERSWREGMAFLQAARSAPKKDAPPLRYYLNGAQQTWDIPLFLEAMQDDARYNGGAGSANSLDGPALADIYALMHDPVMSARLMATSDPEDTNTKLEALLLKSYDALERNAPAEVVESMQVFWRVWQAEAAIRYTFQDQQCFVGLFYGLSGRLAEAEAVFKEAGAYSRCFAFHGDVLEHAGRLADAERVWAEGLKVGPDLPHVYLHRGFSEMRRRDVKAANADLAAATEKAPHYADTWKAWGDLLAGQGQWKEAYAKYDEALKYAPAWAELKQAREEASAKAH